MAKLIVDDMLWNLIEPLLPAPKPRRFRYPGRKPVSNRQALAGILFVLRSGIPWEMLPQELGCGSGMTCWRRLHDWQRAGVWEQIHFVLLDWLTRYEQIDWSRAVFGACRLWRAADRPESHRSGQAGQQTPSDMRRSRYSAGDPIDRNQPQRLTGGLG